MRRLGTLPRWFATVCACALALSACGGSAAELSAEVVEPTSPAAVATTAPIEPAVPADDPQEQLSDPTPDAPAPETPTGDEQLVESAPAAEPSAADPDPVEDPEPVEDPANQQAPAEAAAQPESGESPPTPAPPTPAPATPVPATPVPPTPVPEPTPEPPAPTILVPELTGQFSTIGGGQIDLGSLQGRDVVLWFWAPW